MKKFIKIFIGWTILFLASVIFSHSLKAEEMENVLQTLERIEKDIKDLQIEVYRENRMDSSNAILNNSDENISIIDLRIREIEIQMKQLNEYVEEYVFKIDELNDKMNDLLLEKSQNIIENSKSLENSSEINDTPISNNEDQTLGSLTISTPETNEVESSDDSIVNLLPDGNPDEQYQYAFDLLRSQQLDEAKKALFEFIEKNQSHSLAGSANYWIGEILYLEGSYKEAALVFAEGYQQYPESIKVPDMLLKLSMSLSKIDKIDQACVTLDELTKKIPRIKIK